jgi:hypothetical protein
MFFETKNPTTSQGDIAAAVSKDSGVTWQQLGVVLDEEWHLSYPYIFNYENEVNMLLLLNKILLFLSRAKTNSNACGIYLFCPLSYFTDLHDT